MSEQMTPCGIHGGWVMQIATTLQFLDGIFSASHDKTIMHHHPLFCGQTKDMLSMAFLSDACQIISGFRDKTIKLWKTLHILSCVFSSWVTDSQAMFWDLNEEEHLYTLDRGDIINTLCFSPDHYWLCVKAKYSGLLGCLNFEYLLKLLLSMQPESFHCTSIAHHVKQST
uniref:Small ribosomal subunit protein RACK1 n=1 Tax=Dromaius novaehollandiae TaxID=8790 RepID=A0A8C4JDM7_DRONO